MIRLNVYTAEPFSPLGIWDDEASIKYMGNELLLKYETQPPHGDFIYSVNLPLLCKQFPYWIYGRKLLFAETNYLLAEAVEPYKWSPVISVFFDIHTGRYAALNKWYNKVVVKKRALELCDTFNNDTFVLDDYNELPWLCIG